jgi:long-chain fatty acid transport protein
MRTRIARALWVALGLGLVAGARDARATTVLEVPDNGSEQMGRGGAWVARASDPLATFYNPAGLAGQDTKLTLQANINIQNSCFTRIKDPRALPGVPAGTPAGDPQTDGVAPGAAYNQVCSDASPFPNPQLAFTYKINDRLGIGIAVLGPAAAGNQTWPGDGPQRFLLTSAKTLLLTPTIGVGWEPVDTWRIGAGFLWGIANLDFANSSYTANGPGSPEVAAELKVKQMFIPGFTAGTIWSPSSNLDIAAWYKWLAPIDAKGDVTTSYVTKGRNGGTYLGDTSLPNCGVEWNTTYTCSPDSAKVKLTIPMEAKMGVRYHKPREGVAQQHRRDPMSQDVFDIEADLTWANNSAFDAVHIALPGNPDGSGIVPAQLGSLQGQVLPPNNDVPHKFKDVFGVRLGGDFNAIPDKLALRAGTFFETAAQNSDYANVDFAGGSRIGFALGATYRLRFREDTPATPDAPARAGNALEFSLGFGHAFIQSVTNNGPNGINPIAGLDCYSVTGATAVPGTQTCSDGSTRYRYPFLANLGTFTNAFTSINVGASYRF